MNINIVAAVELRQWYHLILVTIITDILASIIIISLRTYPTNHETDFLKLGFY
jgi:hypothetical protein